MRRTILAFFTMFFLILGQSPPEINANPIVETETEYYTIQGSTAGELRTQMNELGIKDPDGKTWDGFTNWHIEWRFWYKKTRDGCRMTEVKTWVNAKYTFPKWQSRFTASSDLIDLWDRYITALQIHEEGHLDIAVDAATRIEQAIADMEARPSCKELEKAANALGYRILEECKREHEQYDARTGHGRTQGAKFP